MSMTVIVFIKTRSYKQSTVNGRCFTIRIELSFSNSTIFCVLTILRICRGMTENNAVTVRSNLLWWLHKGTRIKARVRYVRITWEEGRGTRYVVSQMWACLCAARPLTM